jgi:hypothetical protein
VASWCLPYRCRCFLPRWENQNFRRHFQKFIIFVTWKPPKNVTFRIEFWGTLGQRSLKPTNPGLSQRNQDELYPYSCDPIMERARFSETWLTTRLRD